jgi:glycosyltransferase involved in cell wall biosynthesis
LADSVTDTRVIAAAAADSAGDCAMPGVSAPRILLVPVSGPYGMGEYARSVAIAQAACRRWHGAAVRLVLSREAPYAQAAPFPATLLPSSATFHSAAVIELLETWRPDVVIFDNAGRTAQLSAARRVGARVVYISARRRQRRKAFRWRWMPLIDEHWIAYPEFIAGPLGFFEKLKLELAGGRPVVRYLDVILPRADTDRRGTLPPSGCPAGTFVLLVPGGGTGHPGAADAASQFLEAARMLAARGMAAVYVGPTVAGGGAGGTGAAGAGAMKAGDAGAGDTAGTAGALLQANLHLLGPVPQTELAQLMRRAQLIVANGGSTLLQSIACGKACIAVPIARDQIERTRRCVAAGVAEPAALDAASMVRAAERLLQSETQRAALAQRAARLDLADGIEVAIRALDALLESTRPGARR